MFFSLSANMACRSDEIASRLDTAMAELQRAKDLAAEKEGTLLRLGQMT